VTGDGNLIHLAFRDGDKPAGIALFKFDPTRLRGANPATPAAKPTTKPAAKRAASSP
jgi:hypothetical protein